MTKHSGSNERSDERMEDGTSKSFRRDVYHVGVADRLHLVHAELVRLGVKRSEHVVEQLHHLR
jgi:hypothetical protein